MARTDDELSARVPAFVHEHLSALLEELGGGASKTRLIGALVYAATKPSARKALDRFDDEVARRSKRLKHSTSSRR
jgi:hypothetical protein